MQDDLGHLNDVAAAERLAGDLLGRSAASKRRDALQRAAGLVLGWHAHSARGVKKKTARKWMSFVEQKQFWN